MEKPPDYLGYVKPYIIRDVDISAEKVQGYIDQALKDAEMVVVFSWTCRHCCQENREQAQLRLGETSSDWRASILLKCDQCGQLQG